MDILPEICVSISRSIMNCRELNTDAWCSPTLTLNSSLKEVLTHFLLLVPTNMACTTLPNHSETPTTQRTHHSTFQGTLLKVFFQISKYYVQFPGFCKILLLRLFKNKNYICFTSTKAEAKLHFIIVNCLTYDAFDHYFNNFRI